MSAAVFCLLVVVCCLVYGVCGVRCLLFDVLMLLVFAVGCLLFVV